MTFIELIEKVKIVDKDASDYLKNDAWKLESFVFNDNINLSCLFSWSDSKQGRDYWSEIDSKL